MPFAAYSNVTPFLSVHRAGLSIWSSGEDGLQSKSPQGSNLLNDNIENTSACVWSRVSAGAHMGVCAF